MKELEEKVEEVSAETLEDVLGGQSALDRLAISAPDLARIRDVRLSKLIVSERLRPSERLLPAERPLPDFAVLMQTEYKAF